MVDASALRDIRDASVYENYALPKLYIKQYYCIEAAVHQRIVRVRSKEDRRNRNPMWKVGTKCTHCDYRKTQYNSTRHNFIKNGRDMHYVCPGCN
jgi:ribosomal protein S26